MFEMTVKPEAASKTHRAQLQGRYAADRFQATAEDEHGLIFLRGEIVYDQFGRSVATCAMRLSQVDDYASVNGWVPQEHTGLFLIGTPCQSEQAPEAVKALRLATARRVVRQIAMLPHIEDDAMMIAMWLTGVDLSNPVERMRCIAEGND